jgi:hypothetical protein
VKEFVKMKRLILILIAVTLFLYPMLSLAKPPSSKKFSAKPFQVDPDETDIIAAAWITHQGLPDSGKSNHALYLQKAGDSAVNAYARVKIKWLRNKPVQELTELGFDYRNGGHCTAQAPRFVVTVDGVAYSVGCTAGVAQPAPDDIINWTRVRFGLAEFAAAGFPLIGTIESAEIFFDEGTDVASGFIWMDNVDVNGGLIGKPGKNPPPLQ